jgi:Flp pilus assembly protein TadG
MPNLLKDRSGAAAVEFGLVALPFFMLMIGTFDLGVYALFKHSAGTLSAAGSRQVIIQAGTSIANATNPVALSAAISTACTNAVVSTVLSSGGQHAPALFLGTGAVLLTASVEGNECRVTAQKNYSPVLPIWGGVLNNPTQRTNTPTM